ncbi:glycosyltransferase [Geodermatophilus sp. DSM 44513]|uniref:glycosyltransferase n=1 Tax=Geodermatophilus sp. DSM 44513 TaxID=1528104 RepID=UPI00128193DD|nr:glycosyltransferase [Geodermatophilus sp. DSM 44513]WNV76004.1 glycosyltransferase [Geodermatophilus sp. DSM 44513]
MVTLLVAATGGHLAQLHQLRPRLVDAEKDVVWATFRTPQSESMLAGEMVEYVDYTAPRDFRQVVRNTPRAVGVMRRHHIDTVISTGSAIALSFLPIARLMGLAAHYIESAARSDGPSTTGRMLEKVPGVKLSSQYRSWARPPWEYTVSVFDDFVAVPRPQDQPKIKKLVVTLGTIEGYHFRSLVERLVAIIPPDLEVLWQVGNTDVKGLPVLGVKTLPHHELHAAVAESDAIIAHAGIGSALAALNAGHRPVLVPRRSHRGEHVDDHQLQIARELDGRDLALHREVEDLTWADVESAVRRRIQTM